VFVVFVMGQILGWNGTLEIERDDGQVSDKQIW